MAYVYENLNPCKAIVGDCVVRGLSKVLNQEWEDTYIQLFIVGLQHCDMPSSNAIWGELLKSKGFSRYAINEDDYTVEDFCQDFPRGTYLVCTNGHVVAVESGNFFDIWDSGSETVLFYWKKEN